MRLADQESTRETETLLWMAHSEAGSIQGWLALVSAWFSPRSADRAVQQRWSIFNRIFHLFFLSGAQGVTYLKSESRNCLYRGPLRDWGSGGTAACWGCNLWFPTLKIQPLVWAQVIRLGQSQVHELAGMSRKATSRPSMAQPESG